MRPVKCWIFKLRLPSRRSRRVLANDSVKVRAAQVEAATRTHHLAARILETRRAVGTISSGAGVVWFGSRSSFCEFILCVHSDTIA